MITAPTVRIALDESPYYCTNGKPVLYDLTALKDHPAVWDLFIELQNLKYTPEVITVEHRDREPIEMSERLIEIELPYAGSREEAIKRVEKHIEESKKVDRYTFKISNAYTVKHSKKSFNFTVTEYQEA